MLLTAGVEWRSRGPAASATCGCGPGPPRPAAPPWWPPGRLVAALGHPDRRTLGRPPTLTAGRPPTFHERDLPPFQQLVDAHWRDVARLAHSLAGPGEGDDVAQQAWTQALAAYPRLQSAANLRSWLMTITARCAMDGHRSRVRRPVAGGDSARDRATGRPARNSPAGVRLALVGPGPIAAGPAARGVALRYVADLDHAGVAAAMGTTPAATRRLVSDALAALRSEVDR